MGTAYFIAREGYHDHGREDVPKTRGPVMPTYDPAPRSPSRWLEPDSSWRVLHDAGSAFIVQVDGSTAASVLASPYTIARTDLRSLVRAVCSTGADGAGVFQELATALLADLWYEDVNLWRYVAASTDPALPDLIIGNMQHGAPEIVLDDEQIAALGLGK